MGEYDDLREKLLMVVEGTDRAYLGDRIREAENRQLEAVLAQMEQRTNAYMHDCQQALVDLSEFVLDHLNDYCDATVLWVALINYLIRMIEDEPSALGQYAQPLRELKSCILDGKLFGYALASAEVAFSEKVVPLLRRDK